MEVDRSAKGGGSSKQTYCKNTVTFSFRAIHLDIVIAPLFDKLDGERSLHDPCQDGVEDEYELLGGK